MDENNINQNNEQQPTTPTPEASGDQGAKLFTQADLDRIIGERLSRERAKAEPSPEDTREADLKELFDTTDVEKFKAAVEKLDGIVDLPSNHRKPVPRIVGPMGGGTGAPLDRTSALLQEAFKPPKI